MTLTLDLARFAVDTTNAHIPDVAFERARMSLASTVASAAMGYDIASATIIRDLECDAGGKPQAAVWFTSTRLPLAAAARVNAVASDAAASDDSDLRSIAHIGTIISTAAVAVAENNGANGADVLAAMVLGYEIAGRIDEALTPGRMQRGFHGSVSTVFGATVAAGRLLQLGVTEMAHAIALAATAIGGMAVSADTSCAREYHAGLSVQTGLQAALAAQRGFLAELRVLEQPRGFFAAMGGDHLEDVTKDLGASWDIVTDMAIKLMPGAHPFHATAEAAADAARGHGITPDAIDQVMISAAVQWTNFKGDPHPRNLVDAAHSLVYFVAAAIVDGGFGWQHMDPGKMADPAIAAGQAKIVFDPAPEPLPDRFPHRHGGTVTIRMKDGRVFRSTCRAPRGSGPRGVEWGDVDAKYRDLAPRAGLGAERIEQSLQTIKTLDAATAIRTLTGQLAITR